MTALVLTRDQAGVRTLSLNSPDRLNALTAALATQLLTALQAAAQDLACV
ncbi:hypothetical protein [Deinococcus radiophilus]